MRETLVNGPRPTTLVEKAAEALGIRPSALGRARKRLNVVADGVGGLADAGEWVLSLPNNPKSLTCISEAVSRLSDDDGEALPL